jgi:hypothetical protein
VLDGPQSVVFDQAENRLYTGQAVLYALIKGLLSGASDVPQPEVDVLVSTEVLQAAD